MYSYRVEQAVRAAAVLHKDQLRKGEMPFPYITHLMSVTLILRDYTQDEDTLVAALLHDTLEDTDYTAEELQEDFGGDVREIVEALSEPKTTKAGVPLGWKERKVAYAKQLRNAPTAALMVAAADKAHNFRTIVEEYFDDHQRFMKDFGKKLDLRLEAYQAIADVLNQRLESDLLQEFNHVFEEYKNFINDVKTSNEQNF